MSQFQQPELLRDDSYVVECFNCGEPLKIKRGDVVHRFWHCDPTEPRGAKIAAEALRSAGRIAFQDLTM